MFFFRQKEKISRNIESLDEALEIVVPSGKTVEATAPRFLPSRFLRQNIKNPSLMGFLSLLTR